MSDARLREVGLTVAREVMHCKPDHPVTNTRLAQLWLLTEPIETESGEQLAPTWAGRHNSGIRHRSAAARMGWKQLKLDILQLDENAK